MASRVTGPGQRPRLCGRVGECATLDGLVGDIRRGESRSLVLRGEAGIGAHQAAITGIIETFKPWLVGAAGYTLTTRSSSVTGGGLNFTRHEGYLRLTLVY